MSNKSHCNDYLVDSSLAEEAIECRRHGYVLTGKFLGQGAYAKVYLGQPVAEKVKNNLRLRKMIGDQNEMKVAIKIISTATAPEVYITKFLPREVASMNKCYFHSNVIQLYDIFASRSRVYLVLEYAECGDLLSFVNQCYARKSITHCLTEDKARIMFRDILAGVQFVHLRGVAHRDLKCENILLTKNYKAKLSDFGFAVEARHSRELLKTHCGSYAYAPPEILCQKKYDGRLADLWSLGVILFAMVNGGLPFKESDAKAVLEAMKKPVHFKGYLTSDCKDLIRGLLRIKPHKRLSIPEVYAHSWMKKHQVTTESDKNASGDVTHQEINLAIYPDSAMHLADNRLGKLTDGFNNSENVLRYIRECMGTIGGDKSLPKHFPDSCRLHTPKLQQTHTKPHFLHRVLACDPSGDPPQPPKLPRPPDKARPSVSSPGKSQKKVALAKGGNTYIPRVVPTPDAHRKSKKLHVIQIDDGEMVVCGGSPKNGTTTLPQVKGGGRESKKTNSRKTPSTASADMTRRAFHIKYEKAPESEEKRNTPPMEQANTPTAFQPHVATNAKINTTPNVIDIKINNVSHRVQRSTGRGLAYVKTERISKKHDTDTGVKNKDRAAGALSVPPPSDHATMIKGKGATLRQNKKDCPTVKYNLTCSHSYRKQPGSSRKAISISPLRSPKSRRAALPVGRSPVQKHTSTKQHSDFISVSKLSQNPPYFSRDIATPYVLSRRYANFDNVPVSQAWSGKSPASTRTTGVAPKAPLLAFRTSSTVASHARKLLSRRSQETRHVLEDPRTAFVPAPSCGVVNPTATPYRAVLRLTNKR